MAIIILIAFIITCLIIDALVKYIIRKSIKSPSFSESQLNIFNENSIIYPKGLFYDKTHTWAFMEENGLVKIGIDDFLVHITGNINRLKMKKTGDKIKKGEPAFSIIQNGKQLNINAPISGTIRFQNSELNNKSTLLNSSPYYEGWVYSIEPSNWLREIQFLILADKYTEWLKSEFARLKDFIAKSGLINNAELTPVILQDGGELKDNLLTDFGPEVWEEFQTKFINSSI